MNSYYRTKFEFAIQDLESVLANSQLSSEAIAELEASLENLKKLFESF